MLFLIFLLSITFILIKITIVCGNRHYLGTRANHAVLDYEQSPRVGGVSTLYVRSGLKNSSLPELCVIIIVVDSISVSSRSSLAFT